MGVRGGPTVGLDDIEDVVITHVHGDHCGGLEQLLFWRRFVTGRKCRVWAIDEVLAGLWPGRLSPAMETLLDANDVRGAKRVLKFDDYCEVRPLPQSAERCRVGDLEVEWRPTVHHVPTSALRFSCGGARFGYSADTAFDEGLIAWLAESELFVHETNYGVHTPIEALVGLPLAVRNKMKVIHYPDTLEVESAGVDCAKEGESYAL